MIEGMRDAGLFGLGLLLFASCHSLDRTRPVLPVDGRPDDLSSEDGAPEQGSKDSAPDLVACDPAKPDSCPGGLDCVADKVCRCIQGGRCTGCCANATVCVANPTAAQCGKNGQSCVLCDGTTADGCVDGACACGDKRSCSEPEHCIKQSCGCPTTELCDGINNDCDLLTDEGCCPVGMTWRADLHVCYSGPHGPADWSTAKADCKSRGGCIGSPATLGLGLCGSWLDNRQQAYYACFESPDTGSETQSCDGSDSSTTCGSCPTSLGCEQRYYCFSAPLLPMKLSCATNSDCGRDERCGLAGACVPLGTSFCCDKEDCPFGCERYGSTVVSTGRCQ